MKIKSLIMMSVFSVFTGFYAQAADAVRSPIVKSSTSTFHNSSYPVFNWDGFYFGGLVNGFESRSRIARFENPNLLFSHPQKGKSIVSGIYTGYNIPIGKNFIAGIDTDLYLDRSKVKHAVKIQKDLYQGLINKKWAGSFRGRIGYSLDRWLPYLTAGVSYSKISTVLSQTNDEGGVPVINASSEKVRNGWVAGAGIDYAVTDNILLRFEYRYNDLGGKGYDSPLPINQTQHVLYHTNDFHVGVAYKF